MTASRDVYLGAFADKVQPRGTPERERYEAQAAEERRLRAENEKLRIRTEAAADQSVQRLLEWGVIQYLAEQPECTTVDGLLAYGEPYGVSHDTLAAMQRAKLLYRDNMLAYTVSWNTCAIEKGCK